MPLRPTVIVLRLLIIYTSHAAALSTPSTKPPSPLPANIDFRNGSKPDELSIRTTMVRELMNPLGIDSNRFIVATTAAAQSSSALIGWAQLRPIGPSLTDPNQFNAPPGSGNYERDVVEEELWDDFDDADFPIGLASLPWTKEYRSFAESARRRREKRTEAVERLERAVKRDEGVLWELASVYVKPDWRGRGVGSELVRRVMARHCVLDRVPSDVFLLTLASSEGWYESLGFGRTESPPDSMGVELALGGIVTRVIGANLICMRYGDGNDDADSLV